MTYPNKLVIIQDGFSLYVPDLASVKSTYENIVTVGHTTPFPFWAKIWPAAKAMSLFLQAEPNWVKDKLVLEIGAGIGLPSLIIAEHASDVIISDYSNDAIKLLEKNIEHLNLQHVKTLCLDWNCFPENISAETILLSDINYAPSQFESLFKLILRFLRKGSTIIISTPQRITATSFINQLNPYIKDSSVQTIQEENQSIDISILILGID